MAIHHSELHSVQKSNSTSQPNSEAVAAINNFISVYNARAAFFSDSFIKKVNEGNRKALGDLQRFPMPPTQMDLRQELAKCLQTFISEEYCFGMSDGKRYTLQELKRLVPEWAFMAEKALMASDPKLADKLMSPAQWNAKSAFEVTFTSAMNEIKEIKKTKLVSGSLGHYTKWVINPLTKAMEQVNAVNPPANALIGYGERISLADAMKIAEGLPDELHKLLIK
jgi:hypothetical protein